MSELASAPLSCAQHFADVFCVGPHFRGHDEGDAMIEDICMSKRVVDGLRKGPLAPHIDRLGERLERNHERQDTRRVLLCAGRFADFTAARRSGSPWADRDLIDFLLEGVPASADAFHARDVRHALGELGLFDVAPPMAWQLRLLIAYDEHLRDTRGLTAGVRLSEADVVRRLLAFHRRRHGDTELNALTGRDVLEHFQEMGEHYRCVASRQKFAGYLRQVLRFLRLRDLVTHDFAGTVPLFVNYRLSSVPNHLAWSDVQRLINAIDVAVAPGRRDRAILLLIAGLGLRPGTIRALTLDEIHWRAGELCIPRTKNRRGINLPLTGEIGEALSEYVLKERPETKLRTVFLRHTSPHRPFASSSAITAMIYGRLDRAGVSRAKGAANLLRHSLATQLVNGGVPIKQVSDVFGHTSIDTTAIYTKVDLASLSKVPMPFALGVTA
ncbi:tyrosine-type recombinase/integrase [Myxococcus sp. AM011]|uniref:tyrosine-type recombinase/integrase n=1 Tax=Myxococcus sp. AM011 TaxID=2745200 RepID=UPI00159543BB|nr:tyrosine-type recombinase/integrase [Myxococcus sp. AM011]NVJ28602.1 tyrosine-type recombinase/integrase [Myxococcus sp. AM011]